MSLILSRFLPYIIAFVGGIAVFFGYGRSQRKKGREEVKQDLDKQDRETAQQTRDRLGKIDRSGSALDRLKEQGRLRDD